ncbi:MAG: recombination mediator RecR [Pseudomonadota bacterium]|jgi:recombination protein RecR
MLSFPPALQKLIKELSKLPSVGEKTATRLAYHLVANDRDLARSLSESLSAAAQQIKLCENCFFLSEEDRCVICRNSGRDNGLLCVVEKPVDLVAIERVAEFKGVYHVLHGLWAPLRGQGPDSMRLKELVARVKNAPPREVIIATSATVEGDATALYIGRILSELGISVTRPAQGIPKGGELEYADEVTLSRAFAARNTLTVS